LVAGRTVTLLPDEGGFEGLLSALQERPYGLIKLTPAHLDLLGRELAARQIEPRCRVLVVGGEALSAETLTGWRRQTSAARIFNEYGPTETVVGCAAYEVGPESSWKGRLPIGRAIANLRLYVLDPWMKPVPAGVSGEIYVGGAGVARGYLGRPDLTAFRFLPDPFAGPGARMYRTGDLARHLPGGDLEYLGRTDRQIKIRGFRVEPGEIEAVLTRDPRVREAVVVLRRDSPGDTRLVAYLVPADGALPGFEELRSKLGAQLPDYMVPAAFVQIAELPLTTNGKVSFAALPAPGMGRPDLEKSYVPPRDAVEEVLAEIWAHSLRLDRVGVFDNFFVLGGDSMGSVRLVALAKDRGLVFTVQELFRFPTIRALADLLRERMGLASAGEERPGAESGADLEMIEQIGRLSDEEVRALLRGSSLAPGNPGHDGEDLDATRRESEGQF
jgi:aryl carrier-like protein